MDKEINIAAKWWTDLLREGQQPHTDTGDSFLSFVFSATQDAPHFTEWALAQFEANLVQVLREAFVQKKVIRGENFSIFRGFGTDYQPGPLLLEAADRSQIDIRSCLPGKTVMWIRPGSVRVKQGYGAPIDDLYGQFVNRDMESGI